MFVFNQDILIIYYEQKPYQKSIDYWISKDCKELVHELLGRLFLILNFIRYAKIEDKLLVAGSKIFYNSTKYVNNSMSNIITVDSSWFTTIVKSNSFKVRGHFRLQPYKDRVELIWIDEFEKTGYTRKAKKLTFYPENETI